MKILNSPVEKIYLDSFEIYLKRDDLLSKDFSGNKARKFKYFLDNEFPNIKKVVGHGSNQSNAMYSLSVLAKLRGWEFEFYTKHLSSYLEQNPNGNYKNALQNGMKLVVSDGVPKTFDTHTLFVNEGGALKEAEYGVKELANEILDFTKENDIKDIEIFLPSGTGTTALFLQKNLPFKVLTCSCVGDDEYLKKQFTQLNSNIEQHPTILNNGKKYHFGKLYKEFYFMYKWLFEQTNIEFELLYDSLGFIVLLDYLKKNPTKKILYIHQGGILGNETMLKRYQRKSYFT